MPLYSYSPCPPGRCNLYGDPHYISFQGVTFDFLDNCTYILVEEKTPRHHLTVAVDNYFCIPELDGSCAKGIILQYRNNTATVSIVPDEYRVKVLPVFNLIDWFKDSFIRPSIHSIICSFIPVVTTF